MFKTNFRFSNYFVWVLPSSAENWGAGAWLGSPLAPAEDEWELGSPKLVQGPEGALAGEGCRAGTEPHSPGEAGM